MRPDDRPQVHGYWPTAIWANQLTCRAQLDQCQVDVRHRLAPDFKSRATRRAIRGLVTSYVGFGFTQFVFNRVLRDV
ncbi:Hypothetical protein NTJ_06140 [Nesidiocoris tenuis]|uniref:Uncharacterized protein n=1 Tax=Nesidiocoris tenuis TaxID=355587 RepID=A0ABN7AQY8_9HEMI|nr:Hypothetical protein NTJ_06140 [Nesidiocoris tenuis]